MAYYASLVRATTKIARSLVLSKQLTFTIFFLFHVAKDLEHVSWAIVALYFSGNSFISWRDLLCTLTLINMSQATLHVVCDVKQCSSPPRCCGVHYVLRGRHIWYHVRHDVWMQWVYFVWYHMVLNNSL